MPRASLWTEEHTPAVPTASACDLELTRTTEHPAAPDSASFWVKPERDSGYDDDDDCWMTLDTPMAVATNSKQQRRRRSSLPHIQPDALMAVEAASVQVNLTERVPNEIRPRANTDTLRSPRYRRKTLRDQSDELIVSPSLRCAVSDVSAQMPSPRCAPSLRRAVSDISAEVSSERCARPAARQAQFCEHSAEDPILQMLQGLNNDLVCPSSLVINAQVDAEVQSNVDQCSKQQRRQPSSLLDMQADALMAVMAASTPVKLGTLGEESLVTLRAPQRRRQPSLPDVLVDGLMAVEAAWAQENLTEEEAEEVVKENRTRPHILDTAQSPRSRKNFVHAVMKVEIASTRVSLDDMAVVTTNIVEASRSPRSRRSSVTAVNLAEHKRLMDSLRR